MLIYASIITLPTPSHSPPQYHLISPTHLLSHIFVTLCHIFCDNYTTWLHQKALFRARSLLCHHNPRRSPTDRPPIRERSPHLTNSLPPNVRSSFLQPVPSLHKSSLMNPHHLFSRRALSPALSCASVSKLHFSKKVTISSGILMGFRITGKIPNSSPRTWSNPPIRQAHRPAFRPSSRPKRLFRKR